MNPNYIVTIGVKLNRWGKDGDKACGDGKDFLVTGGDGTRLSPHVSL